MSRTINCALIGYGYWGANLLRCFSSLEGCDLIACCEPREEQHREIEKKYPRVRYIDRSLDDLLSRSEIEAVIIASPAKEHYRQAKAAILRGKHVFVEKPLATTVIEAKELVELAQLQNVKLAVGHTFLYNDAVRWVKKFIDDGELGQIYYVYMQRLALGQVRQDVDALWNLAPHDLSIVLYWFGEQPTEVIATGMSYLQQDIDDISFVSLRFPSGKFANIHVSWLDPSKTRKGVLVGSKKMVIYDDTSLDQKITVFDKGVERKSVKDTWGARPFHSYDQFALIQRAGDIVIPKLSFREPLQVEAEHFIHCIVNNENPLTDGNSGVDVVSLLEAASESRKLGRTVTFGDSSPGAPGSDSLHQSPFPRTVSKEQ